MPASVGNITPSPAKRFFKSARLAANERRGGVLPGAGWLKTGQGHLVAAPSFSPEQKFIAPDGRESFREHGDTMDMAIIGIFSAIASKRRKSPASSRILRQTQDCAREALSSANRRRWPAPRNGSKILRGRCAPPSYLASVWLASGPAINARGSLRPVCRRKTLPGNPGDAAPAGRSPGRSISGPASTMAATLTKLIRNLLTLSTLPRRP